VAAYHIDPAADWTLLVADETALPAAGTILDEAPAGARVLLVAEVAGEAEQLVFDTAAELTTVWCHRREGHAGFGMLAAQAVRDLTLPAGRGACWVGLEATAMRAVRRHLLDERGMDRQQLYTRGYWKLGAADHPDHDHLPESGFHPGQREAGDEHVTVLARNGGEPVVAVDRSPSGLSQGCLSASSEQAHIKVLNPAGTLWSPASRPTA